MATKKKCSACDEKILNISYMECSNEKCMKLFDLNCLALKLEVFEAFSAEDKSTWICPECVCCNPKHNNQDTPVGGDTPILNRTFTNNVNTRRGNRVESSTTSFEIGTVTMAELLNELRTFRFEVMKRLDSQEKSIQELQLIAEQTRIKLEKIFLDRRVDEVKNKGIITIENKIEELEKGQHVTQQEIKTQLKTFSEILLQKTTDSALNNPVIKKVEVNKCGATKPPIMGLVVDIQNIEGREQEKEEDGKEDHEGKEKKEKEEEEEGKRENGKKPENGKKDNDWKEVTNKKKARMSSHVKKGQNTNAITIKATERKKHLHVWRLHPETSSEALSSYLNTICGSDVVIEKINHKTKRDYASFRITVAESVYNKLCQPEVWPVNTEFTEWIWFRKSNNNTKEAM
ncbi:uncharacterized protein [Choristoneura fumiferana]|uniref:uncharacterized protein n=1 Tax=Choristoneura fumiferana TaxID=7141 RepID=UPI003D15CA55